MPVVRARTESNNERFGKGPRVRHYERWYYPIYGYSTSSFFFRSRSGFWGVAAHCRVDLLDDRQHVRPRRFPPPSGSPRRPFPTLLLHRPGDVGGRPRTTITAPPAANRSTRCCLGRVLRRRRPERRNPPNRRPEPPPGLDEFERAIMTSPTVAIDREYICALLRYVRRLKRDVGEGGFWSRVLPDGSRASSRCR